KHPEIVKVLLAAGATGGEDCLVDAAGFGDAAVVAAILEKTKAKQAALDLALAAVPKESRDVAELLRKAGARDTPPPVKLDAAALKACVGVYRSDEASERKIVLEEGQLVVKSGASTLYTLKAIDKSKFEPVDGTAVTYTFQRDGDKVTGFTHKSGSTLTVYK